MSFLKKFSELISKDIIYTKVASRILLPSTDGLTDFSSLSKFDNPNSPLGVLNFYSRDDNEWLKKIESPPTRTISLDFFADPHQKNQFKELNDYTYEDVVRAVTTDRYSLTLTPNQILECISLHKNYLYEKNSGRCLSFIFFLKLKNGVHVLRAHNFKSSITIFQNAVQERGPDTDDLYVLPSNLNIDMIRIGSRH